MGLARTDVTHCSEHTGKEVPKPIAKEMKESYYEVTLPLVQSPQLLLEYTTSFGTVRVGRILEDLVHCFALSVPCLTRPQDALAGTIAYLHCEDHVR